jgi:hypothetical protein
MPPARRGPSDDRWRRAGAEHYKIAEERKRLEEPYATVEALLAIYCELRHQGDSGEMGTLAQALRHHAGAMEEFGPSSGYRG